MDEKHEIPASQFLVQKHAEIEAGGGAWLSLKMFKNRQEAEKYLSDLHLGDQGRIIEAVFESAK